MGNRDHLDKLRIAASQKTRERDYWLDKLSGELVKTGFPYEYKRTTVVEKSFEAVNFKLTKETSSILNKLSTGSGVRLYIILAAGLTLLIHKYSGSKDIVIGSPILKSDGELELINTVLALRNQIDEDMTFKDLIGQVKQTFVEAGENRNYPIEVLMEQLGLPFSEGDFPLFDVAVLFEDIHARSYLQYININMIVSFMSADGCLEGKLAYNSFLYDRAGIERIITHFTNLLNAALANPDIKVAKIDILSKQEKRELLFDFNKREVEYPGDKTIHRLFEEQVEKTPDNMAVLGQSAKHRAPWAVRCALTYRGLDETTDRLARCLNQKGTVCGDLMGMMVDRSIEMIIGILGILKSGGGYIPLDPRAPAARTGYILEECNIKILLTTAGLFGEGEEPGGWAGETVFIDESGSGPGGVLAPVPAAEVAYVIFTSGSTGNPKGVPISHANLCPLLHWGYKHLDFSPVDRFIQNLSYYFDWSVWEMFMALTSGASLYMITDEILLNPEAQVEFIRKNNITVLHLTPTQCLYLVNSGYKLETLKYLIIGAEKLTYDLVKRSCELITEDCRIFNMYGPTEATIMSAVLEVNRSDNEQHVSLSSIPIGKPVANMNLLILDKNFNLCPVNISGELYISGSGLANGYLNDIEKSAASFIRNVFAPEGIRGERLYKTGDLARWLPAGIIEFQGRADHQVKIRGYRIELAEIENQLLEHKDIKEGVVVAIENEGGERYLCAYIVPGGAPMPGARDQGVHRPDVGELREYLARTLPDYMIPSYFVKLDKLPLNPNGKIDMKALPAPAASMAVIEYTPPRNGIEEKLVEIWSEVLNIDHRSIGIDANFFEIGGHSLTATISVSKIHKEFSVKLRLADMFKRPTVRGLAAYLKEAVADKSISIVPTEKKDYYPLSSAQKRLYLSQKMGKNNITYNMPWVIFLTGRLDEARLREAFLRLIERHESFRTYFESVGGEPVQKIHRFEDIEFEIEYHEIASTVENFICPFDLSRAPLLRLGLIKCEEEKHLLMIDMHHIISDGTSVGIFIKDFVAVYRGETPAPHPMPYTYKDFSEWQRSNKWREAVEEQEQYWLGQFPGEPPITEMPADYPRPLQRRFEGTTLEFEIDKEKSEALRRLAKEEGATLFMVLLAIYNILLSKLSWKEDIVVGTPVIGRRSTELKHIIGMFVTTLALRNYPSGQKTYRAFLNEVKERTLEAFENQDYPFEDLVEKVVPRRNPSRNPLFDTMFTLQQSDIPALEMPGLKLMPYEHKHTVSRFDLTWVGEEREERLIFTVEYCTSLFREDKIKSFVNSFKEIIAEVLSNKDIRLKDIDLSPGFVDTKRTLYEEAAGDFEL